MTKVLDHGFIELVDHMGDDSAIVQAARVSYGNDGKEHTASSDRNLIRYLMNHQHSTPFEMVEIKFIVQAPMDVMRQWIRHRTANVNEYSTRYTEAIDLCHSTLPGEWRLQATDNKQGSLGFLGEKGWPEDFDFEDYNNQPYSDARNYLSWKEKQLHDNAKDIYQERLAFGIAKEQARKDLPLSTYTRLYWKCDLHNIFNFLRLRMDSHAQFEIRQYANAMYELIKPIVPVACEAFEDYVLQAKKFSRMEMEALQDILRHSNWTQEQRPYAMQNVSDREWREFLGKLS
jgi:thymidylate synthase (FAD)